MAKRRSTGALTVVASPCVRSSPPRRSVTPRSKAAACLYRPLGSETNPSSSHHPPIQGLSETPYAPQSPRTPPRRPPHSNGAPTAWLTTRVLDAWALPTAWLADRPALRDQKPGSEMRSRRRRDSFSHEPKPPRPTGPKCNIDNISSSRVDSVLAL